MSALTTLAATWKKLDVVALQGRLDGAAEEVQTRQAESETSRSSLISELQEFFKSVPQESEAHKLSAPIIQSFQREIDSLDVRCRAAETAFLEAYGAVGSISDPVPTLEAAAEKAALTGSKLQDAEIVVKQLKETMGEYEADIVTFKKQDKEFQKLKTKLEKYDRNIDATLNERMIEVTEKLTLEADDKIKAVEEEKAAAVRKYEDLLGQMEVQRRQLEAAQTELFEANQKALGSDEARLQEADMLLNDVESWQQRANLAEKEVERLKEKIDNRTDLANNSSLVDLQHSIEDSERRLGSKEREIERLVEQLNQNNSQLTSLQQTSSAKILFLEAEVAQTTEKLRESESTLSHQSDYELVKKELAILKSLEFSEQEEEVDAAASKKRPVEVLILERSKALQSENTTLRMDKERLGRALDETASELAEKCGDLEKQATLVAELESHVEKLQQIHKRGEAEGRSSSVDILRELDTAAASQVGAAAAQQFQRGSESPAAAAGHDTSSSNLLPIVQAQRERYRNRNHELEEEKAQMSQQLQLVQAEVKQLSADNVKLYEKIRFLQGFGGGGGGGGSKSTAISSRGQEEARVESRYHTQYEQRLDPFTSFSNQERQKRYGNLNIVEKLILWMVRFMLSNKLARLMIFAYAVFLHMLVFMVLMRMAVSESNTRHLAEELAWKQRFSDHMDQHHPGQDHHAG